MAKTCKFKPINDRVTIEVIDAKEQTPGGIVLPDRAREGDYRRATVLAVGPGLILDSGERTGSSLKPGDRVVYLHRNAHPLDGRDEKIFSIRETDVLAIETE